MALNGMASIIISHHRFALDLKWFTASKKLMCSRYDIKSYSIFIYFMISRRLKTATSACVIPALLGETVPQV